MKQMTAAQIRSMFIRFFEEKGHQLEKSASLVPQNDPSLLWINSGVATLKKYLHKKGLKSRLVVAAY